MYKRQGLHVSPFCTKDFLYAVDSNLFALVYYFATSVVTFAGIPSAYLLVRQEPIASITWSPVSYTHLIAKIPTHLIDEEKVKKSNLILVTAITATKAGIGKTTAVSYTHLGGYFSVLINQRACSLRIYSIAVHPDFRGKKVGQLLIDQMCIRDRFHLINAD